MFDKQGRLSRVSDEESFRQSLGSAILEVEGPGREAFPGAGRENSLQSKSLRTFKRTHLSISRRNKKKPLGVESAGNTCLSLQNQRLAL